MAAKFTIEMAKAFTRNACEFYYADEFDSLVRLYGSLKHLQSDAKSELANCG